MVGQRFISLLENHPWFEVTTIAASPRSVPERDMRTPSAIAGKWITPMPEAVKDIVVMNVNEVDKVASEVDFVFSAVDMSKDEIKAIEEAYAKTETPVVSQQQCAQMDTGCTDGSSGDQPTAYGRHQVSERNDLVQQRGFRRCKAKLLHSVLCTGTYSMERI